MVPFGAPAAANRLAALLVESTVSWHTPPYPTRRPPTAAASSPAESRSGEPSSL